MTGFSARFFGSALVYAILGMTLGIVMGITQDHGQMPTHAHIMLIGWVSFALFGYFYHAFPGRAETRLAQIQFWLAQASFLVLIAGLFVIFGGSPEAEPVAAVGSLGLLLSTILFTVNAWPVIWGGR